MDDFKFYPIIFSILALYISIFIYRSDTNEELEHINEQIDKINEIKPNFLSTYIPKVYTPGCSYGKNPSVSDQNAEFPAMILSACTQELAPDVVDFRGTWLNYDTNKSERIEQCGLRIIIIASGIIHDTFIADGTLEHGVNDVSYSECSPIRTSGLFNKTDSSFSFYTENYYEGLTPIVSRYKIDDNTFILYHTDGTGTYEKIS